RGISYSSGFGLSPRGLASLLGVWPLSSTGFDGPDTHPRRTNAQPEEPERRFAEKPADRDHRAVGLREILARLRHALRRGPAPLRRVALGLRAPAPAAAGKARRRSDRAPVARELDRAR